MPEYSHRLRTEENRLFKKLIGAILLFLVTVLLGLYIGIPAIIKVVTFTTSFKSNKGTVNNSAPETNLLFPPALDPFTEATNSSPISISGYGDRDAKIKIYLNDKQYTEVSADSDGKFKALNIKLDEGENIITARTGKDNKISSLSSALNIVYKKTPPKLEITSPNDGDKYYSDHKEVTIVGQTDADSKVVVNDRYIVVDTTGKFSITMALSPGENKFKFEAEDKAGNKTDIERKVTYNP